ncbi:hypothetical protein [Alkalicoccus daliensis]|uniref:WYL domain-containing protein n=1 Tax=Alkalicoccus daliensis TaxID=745820 RepID=A0A1H0F6R9_9BACI|nr:hypothetical protein [Alkalicoccus daliensis]SDN90316.1 hypothetical protein SAMN04488053_104212 [Alkalicoccus daliensis]
MKGILDRAVEKGEKVQVIYLSGEGELTQRWVTVWKVTEKHLVCYCHYRKQKRTLTLSNILSAVPEKIKERTA